MLCCHAVVVIADVTKNSFPTKVYWQFERKRHTATAFFAPKMYLKLRLARGIRVLPRADDAASSQMRGGTGEHSSASQSGERSLTDRHTYVC